MAAQDFVFKAHPSLRNTFALSFLYAALVLYGRITTDLDPLFNPIWWFCLYALLAFILYAVLRRWTTTYLITDAEIVNRWGILARKVTIIPHGRVTNASAEQNVLQRLLGLASIDFDSAGGDLSELSFKNITKKEAKIAAEIIREIRDRATP